MHLVVYRHEIDGRNRCINQPFFIRGGNSVVRKDITNALVSSRLREPQMCPRRPIVTQSTPAAVSATGSG